MKIAIKKPYLATLILAAMLISALLFAVAVFLPSTQPTVTLGQYALANNDLTDGDTRAYRPWFDNTNWQGDVIEYEILAANGSRRTDVNIGATPATEGDQGYCGRPSSGCWSARAGFDEEEALDSSYWQKRNIFTKNTDTGLQTDFLWNNNNLSDTQRNELDPETVSYIAATGDTSLNDDPYISQILNYIRGERVHERSNLAPGVTDAYFRTRYNLLGDVTASPVYIGPPKELLTRINGFAGFADKWASRAARIAVPANDGMLHILRADNGHEVYAYIPSMVIPKLGTLAAKYETYQHTYYLAGELAQGSAQHGTVTTNADGTTNPKPWYTILAGGGGPGFPGLFALDVTEPNVGKLLFERNLADDGFGYIYGKPQIAPLGTDKLNPDWYIVTGNGYSTDSNFPTELIFVSLDNANQANDVHIRIPANLSTGGLSAPTLLSIDGDDIPDLAFAGDLKGNLWMFEIDQSDLGNTSYTKVFRPGTPAVPITYQPISNAPAIAKHPTENGYMVYFGTGSIFSQADALNDGAYPGTENYVLKQAIYGIWVDTSDLTTLKTNLASAPYTSSNLVKQTLAETSKQFYSGGPTQNVRITPTENPVDYTCSFDAVDCDPDTTPKGWAVELPNCGERMIGTPFVRAGRVQFVTTNPTGLQCGERTYAGDSWVMSLDYFTGADGNNTVVYNLNNDSSLSDGDTVPYSVNNAVVNKAPVGLGLGQGNISQPTFARLALGTDKMFINGLILPLPPIANSGDLLGGHIDVETDSPTNGVIATNNRDKHSEGYNNYKQGPDGLGGAVDGHEHNYDGIHDVDFVDLFKLEPRRGKANLISALADPPVNGQCSTEDNKKAILINGACIQAVEGELNRAYDVLHTNADGKLDPILGPVDANGLPTVIKQSEVNSLNAKDPPDYETTVPNTKFIVVLANADLSTGGTLQIGCRYWPVAEYQKMITPQLLAGKSPGELDDTYHNGTNDLVFTLTGIVNDGGGTCANIDDELVYTKGLSQTPTLRVGFGQRALYDEGLVATRAQCVLGLHRPKDKICFTDQEILSEAEASIAAGAPNIFYTKDATSCNSPLNLSQTPPAIYIRDPAWNLHITPEDIKLPDGTTVTYYRWRNGALTVQLLKAYNDDGSVGYTLQTHDLTPGSGIIAQAFTPEQTVGPQVDAYGNSTGNQITIRTFKSSKGPNESGMLYEANIFFHYSALVDGLRNDDPDNTTPPEGACYGGPGYSGHSNIDVGGLNPSEYRAYARPLTAQCDNWTDESKPCPLEQYANLLLVIENPGSAEILNQALLDLSKLLAENALLAEYVSYREYISPKYNYGKDLLDIDRKQLEGGTGETPTNEDGTPIDVETIETIDLEAKGPNYAYGRRNWIDIKQ